MARKHLGKTIDLHAGGQDLVFPHHENEIAQSAVSYTHLDQVAAALARRGFSHAVMREALAAAEQDDADFIE